MTVSRQGSADSKLVLKKVDGVGSAFPDASQRLDHWCKLDPPAFLKRYIEGDFCFCLKLRARSAEIDCEYHYAFFSNFSGAGIAETDDGRISSGGVGISEFNSIPQLGGGACDRRQPVFIKIIEVSDDLQDRILRVRSFVRLYRRDDVFCAGRNAFYRSILTGLVESYCRGANGELVAGADDLAIFKHQRAEEMVQTRSKVMENFTSQNSNSDGDDRRPLCDERILEPIVLKLSDNVVRFGLSPQEGGDFQVEIVDVLFGPLNLGIAAV